MTLKKFKLVACFMIAQFISGFAYSEDVVTHSAGTYIGCRTYSDSSIWLNDTGDINSVKDGFIYVEGGCGSLPQVAHKYLKVENGAVVEMNDIEKAAVDILEANEAQANLLASSRSGAKDSVDQLSPEGVRLRAALLVILDRFNTVTGRVNDVESCIENAGTLSAAKTCLAGLSAIPDATAAQMKTAIKDTIDGGQAD